MNTRKTLLILLGIFLAALLSGIGTGIYYYTHPPKIKALVEKAVSHATGASFSIQRLNYALNPIHIHAEGISFKPADEKNGFSVTIRDFAVECYLSGFFGRKTLHFKRLQIKGVECRAGKGDTPLSKTSGGNGGGGSSFLNSVAKRLVSFFLFKDFRIDSGEMAQGLVIATWDGGTIQASGLSGQLNNAHLVDIRGGLLMDLPMENTSISIPNFHVETTSVVSLDNPRVDGTFSFKKGNLKSSKATIQNIQAKGTLQYDHLKQKMAITDFKITLKDVQGKSGDFHISGPMDVSGTFGGMIKQGQWAFDCHGEGNMRNNYGLFRTSKAHIKGVMTAHMAFHGPIFNLNLSGTLAGKQIAYKDKSLSIKSAEGIFNFSGTYPYFDIRNLSCRIPQVIHSKGKKQFSVEHVAINSSKGQVNILKQSLDFPKIKFKDSLFNNILAAIHMNSDDLKITAQAKQAGLIRAAEALNFFPSPWTFQGTDSMEFDAVIDKKGAITFSAGLALDKFSFQNPDETYLGENISVVAHISGHTKLPLSTIKVTAGIDAHGGEILMDRFYFNLEETPFSAQCNGIYQGNEKSLALQNLSVAMKEIAKAHVTGTLSQAGTEYEGNLSVTIPDTPLKTPFQRLIQEPFQTEKPALARTKLDGILSGKIALTKKRSQWVTRGICIWKDGSMSYGDSILNVSGIHFSLPIWFTNVIDAPATQNLTGGLSVRSIRLPFLPEQGLDIPFEAAANQWIMPTTTTLAVPGGTIDVGPSRIMGLLEPSPVIQSALHFKNLQLESILKDLWPNPPKGIAKGIMDPIYVVDGNLQSKGKIEADIFDGTLTLSQVSARGLFTALPVYGLYARWHHLNLAEMTEGTSFGKIDGSLNGYAKKLEVSNGQLQRFDLLLNTVEADDIPQKISVKAVDNIARLGGGQSPFVGMAGMFVSLFKEFPYKKIGVHATLENDVFRIHGTIREDGREYLVKRGFFSGVDVINQSRDNRVGFKDMLKRINRITSSKGGPVIK